MSHYKYVNKDLGTQITEGTTAINENIKNKAQEITQITRDQAKLINSEIVEFIKENPYKSTAIAFFTGWIIAKLI